MSESRTNRDRNRAALAALDRESADAPPHGTASFAGQTTTTDAPYPAVAGASYAVVPVQVDGAEAEGASATYVRDADPNAVEYAYNLGGSVPPPGTTIVCHACGGRWVFRFDGTGS